MKGSKHEPGWLKGLFELADRGGLRVDAYEPMSRHTSFRIGGEAAAVAYPLGLENLLELMDFLKKEGVFHFVLGRGTNLLAGDGGVEGVAVKLDHAFAKIGLKNGGPLRVGAGVRLARLLKFCAAEGLEGLEFLAGIPGSVGGAVMLNAGARGRGFMDAVRSLLILTPGGEVVKRPHREIDYAYRDGGLGPGEVVLEAHLDPERGQPETVRKKMRENYLAKKKSQPLTSACAGCVFKNPGAGVSSGRLLDALGFKRTTRGGAQVSPVHANFIINKKDAKAKDVLELMARMRDAAKQGFGVALSSEIRLVEGTSIGSPF